MGTCCQLDCSDEDDKMLDEARERVQQDRDNILGWEEYQREMPAIEAANENRAVELLRGNIEAGLSNLPEDFFSKAGSNTILDLDVKAVPTEQECRNNYRIGRELDMENYEIANFPVIMGIKDPETLERMQGAREAIKDEMGRLYHSKLSPWFRDAEVVDRIILVDKNAGETKGATVKQKELIADKSLPRVVHVFRDSKTGKMQEGEQLHWATIHEIVHLNLYKGKDSSGERDFRGIFHTQHREEWIAACRAQLDKSGPPSGYAYEQYAKSGFQDDGFLDPEYIADSIAAWDTNLVEVCPELQEFLDKHLF